MPQDEPPRPSDVFRRRLREARKALGWSQERLATEALGAYATVVTKIENGDRKDITLDEVVALAATLNVSPLAMFVPLEDDQVVRVAEGITADAGVVRSWVKGQRPLDGSTLEAVDAYLEQGFVGTSVKGISDMPTEVREELSRRAQERLEALGIAVVHEEES